MIGHEPRIDTTTNTGNLLTQLASSIIATLEAEGCDDPLALSQPLACVLADLYRAAGAPLPYEVALWLDGKRAPIAYGMG